MRKLCLLFLVFCTNIAFCQVKNSNLLISQSASGNRIIQNDQLESLFPQKPNSTLFGSPFKHKLFSYQLFEKKHLKKLKNGVYQSKIKYLEKKFESESAKLINKPEKLLKVKRKKEDKIAKIENKIQNGSWAMQNFGEAPVYFDPAIAEKNTEKITKFLFNKGLFNAKASFKADSTPLGIKVNYKIVENVPFYINSYEIKCEDSVINRIIKENQVESLIKIKDLYDANKLTAEKTRLENIFKNKGYFLFDKNAITYQVKYIPTDSKGDVQVIMNFLKDETNQKNKIYVIDQVDFIIDNTNEKNIDLINNQVVTDTIRQNNVNFILVGQNFSTKYLYKKLFLKQGDIYSNNENIITQKALQNLDQFKFANPTFDASNQKLKVKYYAVPLEKNQLTAEGGFNVLQGVPGPFLNITVKNRNIFGGLESLENAFRVGYEGQQGFDANIGNKLSFETGFNSTINIPQILMFGKYRSLDPYNPHTQIGLGLNYANRYDYTRLNFRLSTNYSWEKTLKKRFNVSLIDLNLINTPKLNQKFSNILDSLQKQGNNLKEAFGRSFISSLSGSYIYNDNYLGQSQKGKYFRIYSELGGSILNLTKNGKLGFVNSLLNTDSLNYFKFGRLLMDFRRYINVSNKNPSKILAWRINTGLAVSYDKNSEALPYEKYMFAGGSYSLRAWEPRRLGLNNLGIVSDNLNQYNLEQPGNLLLEGSLEYRFPLIDLLGKINGAVFCDFGNVWSIKKAKSIARPSDFKINNFLSQMAVGTGFGFRWDFTYFVIRVDAGAKIIEPLEKQGNKFVLDDLFRRNTTNSKKLNWNLGIGYPF